ncbi:flagellar protein FlgN [Oceanobacillus sp. CFH 90083]|uniref:flagellar protein FlgN n=1 Tax=Oceanobacillus sp. CFH 90083 TaxID=2592336 RepID=UPI001D154F2A|nr:flagellar protein FlgN [Oceanobacillus sp. CFH 90083]
MQLIHAMNDLTATHKDLLELSKRKTEALTNNKLDEFQALLLEEQKYIRQLEQQESSRQKIVEAWNEEQSSPAALDSLTITGILSRLGEEEQGKAEASAIALTDVITELKRQELLNKALLEESMKFVQLSMDLMNPTIKSMNYGAASTTDKVPNRSLFDSKA